MDLKYQLEKRFLRRIENDRRFQIPKQFASCIDYATKPSGYGR